MLRQDLCSCAGGGGGGWWCNFMELRLDKYNPSLIKGNALLIVALNPQQMVYCSV